MRSFPFGAPRRPPAPPRPPVAGVDPALEGLRRKTFAIGRENRLTPAMVKDRVLVRFDEPVFDRLSRSQLEDLIASFETEISERRRVARRTNELIEETARKAVAPLKRSGLRSLNDTRIDVDIDVDAPPFEAGGPSRFAVGLQRMDRGQDVRTGKPIENKAILQSVLSADPEYSHPLLRHVLARFPDARIFRVTKRRAE